MRKLQSITLDLSSDDNLHSSQYISKVVESFVKSVYGEKRVSAKEKSTQSFPLIYSKKNSSYTISSR